MGVTFKCITFSRTLASWVWPSEAPSRRPAGNHKYPRMQSVISHALFFIASQKNNNLLVIVVIIVLEVDALSSGGRRPCSAIALSAACGLLLSSDEVYDGCDDCTVFGLTVLPVHRSGVTNFLLQQRIQLFL